MVTFYVGAVCLICGAIVGYLFAVKNAAKVNADIAAAKAVVDAVKKV